MDPVCSHREATVLHFDPHNHLGGIIPYRVLALYARATSSTDRGGQDILGGEDIVAKLLANKAFASQLEEEVGSGRPLTVADVEDYLAHHEIISHAGPSVEVLKVKPLTPTSPDLKLDHDPVWMSALAYGPGACRRVVGSASLPQLEVIILARFFGVVRDMLARAQQPSYYDWGWGKDRLAAGTGVLGPILEAMNDLGIPDYRPWLNDPLSTPTDLAKPMKHLLQYTFTATPLTDFDTAYVARGFLQDPNLFASEALTPLTLDIVLRLARSELTRQGVKYAEVSVGAVDITYCAEQGSIGEDGVPRIGWLLNIANTLLVKPELAGAYEKAVAALRDGLAVTDGAPRHPEIAGFSILAPEEYDYSESLETLCPRLISLLEVCRDSGRRCVAHIHVGEGWPKWRVDASIVNDLLLKRATLPPDVDAAAMRAREDSARRNIDAILSVLKNAGQAWAPSTRVRLGHVTHATSLQAERMHHLGLWADVNLTSNVATSAWYLDDAIDLKRIDPQLFQNHGIHAVADKNVSFVLGTDGGGVEHSALAVEAELMRHIAGENAIDWEEKTARNAAAHVNWITDPGPLGSTRDAQESR